MLVPLNQSKYYMNKNQFIKTQLKIKIILITLVPLKQQMYLLTAYRNPWTLDARVERWTLNAVLWTLETGRWTLGSGLWTLHLGSQALGTKNSCQLVQNKIRTQFQFLILSRGQVLTLNVKCYVIKKYRNKLLL